MHRFFIISVLIFAALAGGLYYIFNFLPESQWLSIASEQGAFEMLSAILFGIAAFLGLVVFIKTQSKMDFIFMMLMGLACARELDLHKEWTTQSILKSRFYIDPNTPALEKIIGVIVILFLVYSAWQLIKRVPQFIASVWHFVPTAWAIGLGLGMITIAKLLDSMKRVLPFMAEFHTDNRAFLGVIEESMELSGAIFFLIYVMMRLKRA